MRYVSTIILLCALAAPAAQAVPAPRLFEPSVSKASRIVTIAKRSKAPAQRQSRGGGGTGGIHPLVGSGGY
jgi:hypothetical protein